MWGPPPSNIARSSEARPARLRVCLAVPGEERGWADLAKAAWFCRSSASSVFWFFKCQACRAVVLCMSSAACAQGMGSPS